MSYCVAAHMVLLCCFPFASDRNFSALLEHRVAMERGGGCTNGAPTQQNESRRQNVSNVVI